MDTVFMFLKNRKIKLVIFCIPILFVVSCGASNYDNIERNKKIDQLVNARIVEARNKEMLACAERLNQMAKLKADSIIASRGNAATADEKGVQNSEIDAQRRKPLTAKELRALQKKGEINLTLNGEKLQPKPVDSAK
jgi:hypothetical protein